MKSSSASPIPCDVAPSNDHHTGARLDTRCDIRIARISDMVHESHRNLMTEHDSRGENGSRSVVERGTNVSQMEDGLQMLAADPESQDMADSVEPSNHSFQPPYRIQRWNTEYDFYQVG